RAREPGLIHRLDTETSGLLVVARTDAAFGTLTRALRGGRITKRYLAIVAACDLPEAGVIDRALGPDPSRRGRVRVVTEPEREDAKASTTRHRGLERTPRVPLVWTQE